MGEYVVAVDVGTGSARAAVVDRAGILLARSTMPLVLRHPDTVSYEYNSTDIWTAVCRAVRTAIVHSKVSTDNIDAIGFDATCSLVVLDASGGQVSIGVDGEPGWDTFGWQDHRASAEADHLNAMEVPAVHLASGLMSPEMQFPKLKWLKTQLAGQWRKAGLIFDLADYLTFRATGNTARSLSTLVTKWNFSPLEPKKWPPDLLAAAGLKSLDQKAGIEVVTAPGKAMGTLSATAAAELGLHTKCRVAPGMVDAYAGLLALLGPEPDLKGRAALIAGTSSCVMHISKTPVHLDHYWGPYPDAALLGYSVTEGGQSATGALLDHIIRLFGMGRQPTPEAHSEILDAIQTRLSENGAAYAGGIHVLPDFHGNRSPLGDPHLRGSIAGLGLDERVDSLYAVYYRTIIAIALGVRQIIDGMENKTGPLDMLAFGGGHSRSPFISRLYADVTGRTILTGSGDETMLLGSAMNAAAAAGWQPTLQQCCMMLRRPWSAQYHPGQNSAIFERDYRIFQKMQQHRRELAEIGASAL
jgi:hypothetical protein